MNNTPGPISTHEPHPRRWLILAVLIGIMLMPPIDGSALNVAISVLQHAFNAPLAAVAWVPLIYLLIIGSLILPMGRLGDLWGFRRLFLLGVVLFTLASALCGFAPSLPWLIGGRVLQALGASMMMALNTGIITAIFSAQERGRALGIAGMGIATGLVIGPTLGGFLVQYHWSWIFFINVPIGIIGGFWCWRVLPEVPPTHRQRVDWLGALLVITSLGALLLAVTQGEDWGWGAPRTLGLLAYSLAGGTLFYFVERRNPEPMLDLTLFHNPVFTGANIATMMNYLGQFSALFLTPLLLQSGLHWQPEQAGLMMASIPLAVIVLAPISGALSDRLGTRGLATVGEAIVVIGLLGLGACVQSRNFAAILPALVTIGIGTGLFQAPNSSAIMGSVPRHRLGIGGGILATMRNVGMAFGIAISSAIATIGQRHYLEAHPGQTTQALFTGIEYAFYAGAFFVLLGALTSLVRQDQAVVEG
ncbi:MAG: MFS transporter [Armatimonadota bacterium]